MQIMSSNFGIIFLFMLLCISFVFSSLLINAQSFSWKKILSPTNFPSSIDMVSSTDVWAVGNYGSIIHWDGSLWKNVTSPTKAFIKDVDMLGSSEGYALVSGCAPPHSGYLNNHSIIRWDGTEWTNITIRGWFTSIDMVSSFDGWVVGTAGTRVRWDGLNWNYDDPVTYQMEFPNGNFVEMTLNERLESVDMVSSTDGWAVGWRGTIIHWNGTSWNIVDSPEIFEYRTIWSVDMVSSTDGWAVGDEGRIIHWDGANWDSVTSPTTKHLFCVDMIDSLEGWAVGSDGCIIHWDGISWNIVESPTAAWLTSIDMINSSDGWILGDDGLYRWQETKKETSILPIEFLLIFIAVVVIVIVWFLFKKSRKKDNL